MRAREGWRRRIDARSTSFAWLLARVCVSLALVYLYVKSSSPRAH